MFNKIINEIEKIKDRDEAVAIMLCGIMEDVGMSVPEENVGIEEYISFVFAEETLKILNERLNDILPKRIELKKAFDSFKNARDLPIFPTKNFSIEA